MVALKNIENPVVFEDLLIKEIFFFNPPIREIYVCDVFKNKRGRNVKTLQTAFSIGRSRVHLDMAIHQVLSDVREGCRLL